MVNIDCGNGAGSDARVPLSNGVNGTFLTRTLSAGLVSGVSPNDKSVVSAVASAEIDNLSLSNLLCE